MYAMRLISQTGAASEFTTLRRDTNEHIIIIIIIIIIMCKEPKG